VIAVDETLRKIIVRKSAYMNWRLCPKLYEYVWEQKHESGSSAEGDFGSMFHSGGEQFFMEVNQNKLLQCKTAVEALKVFEPFSIDHPVVGPWFENFKAFEANRWKGCIDAHKDRALQFWLPVVVELELFSPLCGTEMHIDRINRYTDHELMNVEYKTEKMWLVSKLREELAFYNIGINTSKMFSDPCQYIAVFNPQLNKAFMERITTRLLKRLLTNLVACKESIRDKAFHHKPSYFCRYCPRLQICLEEDFGNISQKPEVTNNG
jgi:hypothetical protein